MDTDSQGRQRWKIRNGYFSPMETNYFMVLKICTHKKILDKVNLQEELCSSWKPQSKTPKSRALPSSCWPEHVRESPKKQDYDHCTWLSTRTWWWDSIIEDTLITECGGTKLVRPGKLPYSCLDFLVPEGTVLAAGGESHMPLIQLWTRWTTVMISVGNTLMDLV